MEKIPMTAAGHEALEKELKHLKSVERPAIIRAIAEAREHGDLSENAEYHSAKEKQSFIEGRIKEIEGILGEKDAHCVITEFQQPTAPRYDYKNSGADERWIKIYSKMDLSHVYGFPLWEQGVFELLHASFEQLRSIFDYYAKSGTAGSSSTGALLTMQQTELQTLALDVGMNSEKSKLGCSFPKLS